MQDIDPTTWVHESALLYGRIKIGRGSSIWPRVVMRSENAHISIGRMTNIQDFAMVHIGAVEPVVIGDFCSITHHCTIHGATIGDECLIGINATIMDGAVIGAGSIVAGGAFVTEGSEFPENSIIMGAPAKLKATRDNRHANRLNAWMYHRNAQFYAQGRHDAWSSEDFDEWRRAKMAEIAADEDLEAI